MPRPRRIGSRRAGLGRSVHPRPRWRPHGSRSVIAVGSLQFTRTARSEGALVSTARPQSDSCGVRVCGTNEQVREQNRQVGRREGPYRLSLTASGLRDAELVACHEHSVGLNADADSCPQSCPFAEKPCPVVQQSCPRSCQVVEECRATRSTPREVLRAASRRQPRRTPCAA